MLRDKRLLLSLVIGATLSVATLFLFWPLGSHEFISYDDGIYITGNAHVSTGLTTDNVEWAFTTGHGGNWHPLTWLSHMLDAQWFGLNPGRHHLASAIIHSLNAWLLFLAMQRLTGATWRSALTAAIFAVHPLHVESVAWASERKDVLSAFFCFLCLWSYAGFAKATEGGHSRKRLFYWLALVFFACGLMSKPMLVTLPFVMLLLDYWPLRRITTPSPASNNQVSPTQEAAPSQAREKPDSTSLRLVDFKSFRSCVLEKIPFFVLTIASCVATVIVQKHGGAVVSMEALPFGQRVANAIMATAQYLEKAFWPSQLALFYPLHAEKDMEAVALSAAIVLLISGLAIWQSKRHPYLFTGWFWFLGMLVPVLGFVQVGMQQMADRYTYLTLIGVSLSVIWLVEQICGTARIGRITEVALASATLVACASLTVRQIAFWQDTESVFAHSLKVTPNNYIALSNHGSAVMKKGNLDEAVRDFEAAIRISPNADVAHISLGEALTLLGRYDEAEEHLKRVLSLDAANLPARQQLGVALSRQGKYKEAEAAFLEVIQRNPNDVGAENNLGNVLSMQGRDEEALQHLTQAARLQPGHANAQNNLGITYKKLGRYSDAIVSYRQAIQLNPNFVEALNNLSWVLATCPDTQYRNGNEAVQMATRAAELTQYSHPAPLIGLAAAYGELGKFQDAMAFVDRARERISGSNGALTARLDAMQQAFRNQEPFHENSASE